MNNLPRPERYLNRELSWLEFDARVLEEACSPSVPLLERVKFSAITAANLDEFFMVRVAGLHREAQDERAAPTTDGLTPRQQLMQIAVRTRRIVARLNSNWNRELRPGLASEGIRIAAPAELSDADRAHLDRWFERTLAPVLTPLAIDAGHPFPVLVNNGLYLAASVSAGPGNLAPDVDLLLVQVPPVVPRFTPLPGTKPGTDRRLMAVEDVIRLYAAELFRGYTVHSAHCFRVSRDSDIVLDEDDADSLPEALQAELRRRRLGAAVRMEVEADMPAALRKRLAAALDLEREDVYRVPGLLGFGSLMEIVELPGYERLRDEPLPPLPVRPAPEEGRNWFDVIARGDVLMHHPYQSFDPVIELLEQAAADPDVLAVKQTLYRAAKDSRVIRALLRAAENGKQVAVLMELKARFDEERNLDWARKLEAAGAHVIYGVAGLKTHCKALLIVRREPDGIRRYVHLSTGNYNERTARVYTDLGLFTARREFGEDISGLFNVITGCSAPPRWNLIAMAPTDLKPRLLGLIEREANLSAPGSPGRIVAKLNSLVDEDVIDALYAAAGAGVKIDLIIRGICRLRPGAPGLSESIRVFAVLDRFLEHSRVFHFRNGGDDEVYLSSADWMQRNFHRRIELLFPVLDETARRRIRASLDAGLRDTVKGWELHADGRYTRRRKQGDGFRSQAELYRELASQPVPRTGVPETLLRSDPR